MKDKRLDELKANLARLQRTLLRTEQELQDKEHFLRHLLLVCDILGIESSRLLTSQQHHTH